MIYIAKIIKEWKNMTNPLVKKFIVITSVVLVVVLGAVILALATGNTTIPTLSDPKGIFYERLDDNGKVIYSITNQEIYEQVKANNGIQQLLMMVDASLLSEYLDNVTEDEIEEKIKQLTYGTADDEIIAELDEETRTSREDEFARSMVLSGYVDNEAAYASLLIAREKYALDTLREELTEIEVATAFISSYFEDMQAISIRFTSKEDADDVLRQFHLANVSDERLAIYKGFVYSSEVLKDNDDNIVEAYEIVKGYYFDEDGNILDTDEEIVYTLGEDDIYTDGDDNTYSLDVDGNLVDDVLAIIVNAIQIKETLEEAETFEEENLIYYYMSKVDPYDKDEEVLVKDADDNLVYTINKDGKVFDTESVDVTNTHKLIFNKTYKLQKDVTVFTSNNTIELTEQEVLNYYILMYNYVYQEFRDTLPENATIEDLVALENEHLMFNFEETKAKSSALATYLFKTISKINDKTYAVKPQAMAGSSLSFYHMVYKLDEPTKLNLGKVVLDLIEQSIVLPENIVESITLPTTSEYNATITWVSADKTVISNAGVVTTPAVATKVDLSYTIRALGETRTGKITVNILPTGTNSEVGESNVTFPSLKTMIGNNDLYEEISNMLLDTKVYGSNGSTNITNKLNALRKEVNLQIYDYFLALDYRQMDSTYEINKKGHKSLVASIDNTLISEDRVEFTADDLQNYALAKNPAVYTVYAAQFKELLNSAYYLEAFGTQTNIKRNDTQRMQELYQSVSSSKQYYAYMKALYEQYGMQYPHKSFSDYAYITYGTKTELELLQHFVSRELQPYLINDVITQYNVVEGLFDIVEDNYVNYFSLDVVQLLVFIDFDEDGSPDDYYDYINGLSTEEQEAFYSLLASLEIAIDEFDGNFTTLVSTYLKATRSDETWGVFKQKGILLLTEDLNIADSEQENVKHSLNYSGEYGVKDSYAEEFTQALIDLYREYKLPQNQDLAELYSDLVVTQFGLHLILVEKGDDFDRPSAKFTETDANGATFSESAYNDSDLPTVEQMELYATYKFYEMVYNLTDADVEEKYNITVPKIPASVKKALDFYFDGVLEKFYVLGSVNIILSQLLSDGRFLETEYTNLNNAQMMANLAAVEQAYYDAIVGKYVN